VSLPPTKYLQLLHKAQLVRLKSIAKVRQIIAAMQGAENLRLLDLNGYAVWGHREGAVEPPSIGSVLGVDTMSVVNRYKVAARVDENVISELIRLVGQAVGFFAADIDFAYEHSEMRAYVKDLDYTGFAYVDDLGIYVEYTEIIFDQEVPTRYYLLIKARNEMVSELQDKLNRTVTVVSCACADGRTVDVNTQIVISTKCPMVAAFLDAVRSGKIYEGIATGIVYTPGGQFPVSEGAFYIIEGGSISDVTAMVKMLQEGNISEACAAVDKFVLCASACVGAPS